MKSTYIIFTLTLFCLTSFGQTYSGKFQIDPAIRDFKNFTVTAEPVKNVADNHINVRAINLEDEIFSSTAQFASPEIIETVLKNFRGELSIISVYEGQLEIYNKLLPFYLVGYRGVDGSEKHFLLEKYTDKSEDALMVNVDTYQWSKTNTVQIENY
ncbi:hypothetical protein [Reichenbachiella versicolor]|uniref:hypothetical protein n=1 Tax=Reichenbachiella versicolor TaxID=1821036 RepID=UPI000D6DCD59|nr:hypothetical protein [Reichenbachiella versicolor]